MKAVHMEDQDYKVLESEYASFYQAIRSGDTKRLENLISGSTIRSSQEKLDELLSRAYGELRLKNVPIPSETKAFVEITIIGLRFFSDRPVKDERISIRERIKLVIEAVELLGSEYSQSEVDEKFLFAAEFIARNIYILKHQLKWSYRILPWEEMEFYLVSFISSYATQQVNNLYCYLIPTKDKVLFYLQIFVNKIQNEINGLNVNRFSSIAKLKREKVIKDIIRNNPEFAGLYSEYEQIRDIDSLEKIRRYIQLALSANPAEGEGQLIIMRVLHALGEYLKNTLQSPKLSETTSQLLILSLPKDTRKIIIDLRNSLLHPHSLLKKMEIEKNAKVSFLSGIQSDIKEIGDVVASILHKNKMKILRMLAQKIIDSESLHEMKQVIEAFNNAKPIETIRENFKISEHEKLENLIKELSAIITDKTTYEKRLFGQIQKIIDSEKDKLEGIGYDHFMEFVCLKRLDIDFDENDDNNNKSLIQGKNFAANQALEIMTTKVKQHKLKDIAQISMKIYKSTSSRMKSDDILRLILEIFYIAESELNDVKWIRELREKLSDGTALVCDEGQKDSTIVAEEYNCRLEDRISELRSILAKYNLNDDVTRGASLFRSDAKLQAVIELLFLDIVSILDSSLENNLLFLDDNAPLLIGRCLRNHLAHDNALFSILSDSSTAVLSSAIKLTEETIVGSKRKLGKCEIYEPEKLRSEYNRRLNLIVNQRNMFIALEGANKEEFENCLKNGADINSRGLKSWSALHFAAKGGDLEIIKIILRQGLDCRVKNADGQSLLHIASSYGRKEAVEFLIKEMGLDIDIVDNEERTPLHLAAACGHNDTVEILLKHKAKTTHYDSRGLRPLHSAVRNNHLTIVRTLAREGANVVTDQSTGGNTALHIAAELGHCELAKFLLTQEGADPNIKNDSGWSPLHLASLNGHDQLVDALISKGAAVNVAALDGRTPLHYAVENGHELVTNVLLRYGAHVNVFDRLCKNTPLHYAAKDGHEQIVKALIGNQANIDAVTYTSATPLHLAAQEGHVEIVEILLKLGANINVRDKIDRTPLHYAVGHGAKVARILLNNKAEVSVKDIEMLTPLHLAASKNDKEIAVLLIQEGASIDAKAAKGDTPLHMSAMNNSTEVLEVLLKNRAEIHYKNGHGMTPLHVSAYCGSLEATIILVQNNAKIEAKDNQGMTPLHRALHTEKLVDQKVINFLIKSGAQVNARTIEGVTPLHVAVESGNKEIVKLLVASKAGVNIKRADKMTSLCGAINGNHREIVEILIRNGANVNENEPNPLHLAVARGYRDIVKLLVKNKAVLDDCILHLAAKSGDEGIFDVLINGGAIINAVTKGNYTPLHIASLEGHKQIVKILLNKGADANSVSTQGSPIYMSVVKGDIDVIKALINGGAKVDLRNFENMTALELAVAHGRLKVVKTLLEFGKADINARGNDGYTVLHIASQENNFEIVKYLVNNGSDVNAMSHIGLKPIHIAAREGHKDIVEFFLNIGLDVNEQNSDNQVPLHYAAMKGQLEVVEYLIIKGADINARDNQLLTPLHIATHFNQKDVTNLLLAYGAVHNLLDQSNSKPIDLTADDNIHRILYGTDRLFAALKHNEFAQIESYVNAGAGVNAKDDEGFTPLHYAAKKGHDQTVDILLRNKANPNMVSNDQSTALHYAASFSHSKIVLYLLSHGAIYNAVSGNGKTPRDLATDRDVIAIFNLIDKSFSNLKRNNHRVIEDLSKVTDINKMRAVVNANNKDRETLVAFAIKNNFAKIDRLKELFQDNVSYRKSQAEGLLDQGCYNEALSIFENLYEVREGIFGRNNPATLEMRAWIAKSLYKQGKYSESLKMLEETYEKQLEILGMDAKDTLDTRSAIATVLQRQEKNEEAFIIFQEVYSKQNELFGSDDPETLKTQFNMAMVLERLAKNDEALSIYKGLFIRYKSIFGENGSDTIRAQNNMAMIIANQGNLDEASEIFKAVIEKKIRIFGRTHPDTIRTSCIIANLLLRQDKYDESLDAYTKISDIQKSCLGPNHPETIATSKNIAAILLKQGKVVSALKTFREVLDRSKAVFEIDHPIVLGASNCIRTIILALKRGGTGAFEVLEQMHKDIHDAIVKGDTKEVESLLMIGVGINDIDLSGKTVLHYAVDYQKIKIINLLLEKGADVTQVTNEGNTPLHTAVLKGNKQIVEILLSCDNTRDFINAATFSGRTTSLHMAAVEGYVEITKLLLKRGAIYNIKNSSGQKPVDLSNNDVISNLFNMIEKLFEKVRIGNKEAIAELRILKGDEFSVVTNTRNGQGHTLLQVALANKHKAIASDLSHLLRKPLK